MSVSMVELFDDVFRSEEYCVLIDEAWANRQSKKYTSKLRESSKSKNYIELAANELTEEGLCSALAQFKVILEDQSAYQLATKFLDKKASGVMVFHNSHLLSADLLELISKIIRYVQRNGLKWKFVFLGLSKEIDSAKLDQLFIEKVYPFSLTKQVKAKKPLAFITALVCLVVLTLLLIAKPEQDTHLNSVVLSDAEKDNLIKTVPPSNVSANSQQDDQTEFAAPSAELLELIRKSEQRDLEFKGMLAELVTQERTPSDDNIDDVIKDSQTLVRESKITTKIVKQLPQQAEAAIRDNDLLTVQQILVSNDLQQSVNERGETPLIIAANTGNQTIVEWLLTQNVPVNSRDNFGRTAIFYTAINGDDALLERLLQAGAKAGVTSNLSKTPLMAAVNNNHFSTAQLLLLYGASVDVIDHSGWSAIFYAVWNSNLSMIKLMLDNGANTTVTDNSGLSLKQIAEARGQGELVDLL